MVIINQAFGGHTPAFMQRRTYKELGDWLNQKAKSVVAMRTSIVNKKQRAATLPEIGKLYFYFYDAKWKAKLPIWDEFPLTLPIEPYADGFLGLNLHYLDQSSRMILLNQLLTYRNNDFMDDRTKLRVSYEFLKTAQLSVSIQPAVKRYLYSHVYSPFIEVVPSEYQNAIQLPVQKWHVK